MQSCSGRGTVGGTPAGVFLFLEAEPAALALARALAEEYYVRAGGTPTPAGRGWFKFNEPASVAIRGTLTAPGYPLAVDKDGLPNPRGQDVRLAAQFTAAVAKLPRRADHVWVASA